MSDELAQVKQERDRWRAAAVKLAHVNALLEQAHAIQVLARDHAWARATQAVGEVERLLRDENRARPLPVAPFTMLDEAERIARNK